MGEGANAQVTSSKESPATHMTSLNHVGRVVRARTASRTVRLDVSKMTNFVQFTTLIAVRPAAHVKFIVVTSPH